MTEPERFLVEHARLTRRYFLRLGSYGAAAVGITGAWSRLAHGETPSPALAEAIAKLEPYFTPPDKFRDVSRGKPMPHKLPDDKKREVGLARETWRLEVISDPEKPAKIRKPLTKADGTALDFAGLMELAEKHAVRFAKVMTCLNIGCPLGMGIWEGVPLRELVWLHGAARGPAARLLLRLPQRRPQADVPQLAADRPRAGRLRRPAAGDPLLQAQRPVAHGRARRAGADRRARGLRLQVDQMADRTSCSPTSRTPTTPMPTATTTSIAR